MSSTEKDIEQKVRKLDSDGISKGKELEALSQAQAQLQNINNERLNNIRSEREYASAVDQNNQNISQIAGIMAQQPSPQTQQGLSPGTQAILSKYGYGQPGTKTSRSSSRQVTPQNIVINNNTENKTTNNIQVPQQATPVVKPAAENTGRFKAWLDNEFARQKEQSAIREKEFEKREWSLSRTTNKLMDFIKDIGSSISENLNPKKISSFFGDEIKTLMFLFGFNFLANNWKKVLLTVDKIEGWIRDTAGYFGVGKLGKELSAKGETFIGDLKRWLGGKADSKETLGQTLYRLFWNPEGTGGKGIFDLLLLKFKHFFEARADAVKAVKIPTSSSKEPLEILKTIGLYLKDVITAFLGGKEGLMKSVGDSLQRDSMSKTIGEDHSWANKNAASSTDSAAYTKNTSYGDAVISLGTKSQNYMESKDFTSSGELINGGAVSIKQSKAIGSMLSDTNSGTVHTTGIIGGFKRLSDSASKHGTTLVDNNFFSKQLEPLGLDLTDINDTLGAPKKFKYISVPKEVYDKIYEGTDAEYAGLMAGANQALDNAIPFIGNNALETGTLMATGAAIGSVVPGAGTLAGAAIGAGIGYVSSKILHDPIVRGMINWGTAKVKEGFSKDNKLLLVPADEFPDEPGEMIPVYDEKSKIHRRERYFEFHEVTPEIMDRLRKKIGDKINMGDKFSFGFEDTESVKKFSEFLVEAKKKVLEKNIEEHKKKKNFASANIQQKKLNSISSDLDYQKHYSAIEEYNAKEKKRQEEFNKEWNESRISVASDNIVEDVKSGLNTAKNFFTDVFNGTSIGDAFDRFQEGKYSLKAPEKISNQEQRRRVVRAMNFSMNELGLTKEQAAGLAGNFLRESQMITTAKEGTYGATGIAQWLGVRKKAFEHSGPFTEEEKAAGWKYYDGPGSGQPLGNASFEDQLKFVKWEMENIGSYKNGLKKIKEAKTVDEAAANVFGYYEFSVGPEKAVAHMIKHKQDGLGSLKKGIEFARDALLTYDSMNGVADPMSSPEANPYLNKDSGVLLADESTTEKTDNLLEASNFSKDYWASASPEVFTPEENKNLELLAEKSNLSTEPIPEKRPTKENPITSKESTSIPKEEKIPAKEISPEEKRFDLEVRMAIANVPSIADRFREHIENAKRLLDKGEKIKEPFSIEKAKDDYLREVNEIIEEAKIKKEWLFGKESLVDSEITKIKADNTNLVGSISSFDTSNLASNIKESKDVKGISEKVEKVVTELGDQKYILIELTNRVTDLAMVAASSGNNITVNNQPQQKTRDFSNIAPWSGNSNIGI